MENSDIKYLDIFFSPIQINQLDLNIDSLIEFCYEMKRKDEKGSKISILEDGKVRMLLMKFMKNLLNLK